MLLIALHLAVNLPLLSHLTIDLDEPFSIFHSQHSLKELFRLFENENNPPLHFVLLHSWIKLFGIGPVAVRSLSLLFSVLTIPVLYQISKRFINSTGAVLLPILFIFSDFHHYHALEARPYSLLVLEFSTIFYCILKILYEGGTKWDYLLLGLMNALLFYTHYISLYFFPAELLVLLIFFRRAQLRHAAVAITSFLICIVPWIPVLWTRIRTVSSGGTWVKKPQLSELYGFINKFFNDKWAMPGLLLSLAILVFLNRRSIVSYLSGHRKKLAATLLLFTISYAGAFIVSLKFSSIFLDRYLFFLTIPLFFLAAMIFSELRYGTACFAGFLVIYLLRFDFYPENNRNSAQIAYEARETRPAAIFITPAYYDLAFLYYYDRQLFAAPDEHTFRKGEKAAGIIPLHAAMTGLTLKNQESILLIGGDIGFGNVKPALMAQLEQAGYVLKEHKTYPGAYESLLFIRR